MSLGLWTGLVGWRESVLGPGLTEPPSKLAIRIKKPIKTKFRLPVFNWTALKPNQISGTVFSELDDEKILEVAGPGALRGGVEGWEPDHAFSQISWAWNHPQNQASMNQS